MLEDIKNVMSSKRANSDLNSKVSHAFVQDTKTGQLYEVKTDSKVSIVPTCHNSGCILCFKFVTKIYLFKQFLIGRSLKSSMVIEELYISRSHSTIRYENDQFLLKDNVSEY